LERHAFENLILLCPKHHKIVDDPNMAHTIGQLKEWKADRERETVVDGSLDEQTANKFAEIVVQRLSREASLSGAPTRAFSQSRIAWTLGALFLLALAALCAPAFWARYKLTVEHETIDSALSTRPEEHMTENLERVEKMLELVLTHLRAGKCAPQFHRGNVKRALKTINDDYERYDKNEMQELRTIVDAIAAPFTREQMMDTFKFINSNPLLKRLLMRVSDVPLLQESLKNGKETEELRTLKNLLKQSWKVPDGLDPQKSPKIESVRKIIGRASTKIDHMQDTQEKPGRVLSGSEKGLFTKVVDRLSELEKRVSLAGARDQNRFEFYWELLQIVDEYNTPMDDAERKWRAIYERSRAFDRHAGALLGSDPVNSSSLSRINCAYQELKLCSSKCNGRKITIAANIAYWIDDFAHLLHETP
jgi:hypothetical protein